MNALTAHYFLVNATATKAAINKLNGEEKTAKLLEIFTAVDTKTMTKEQKRGFAAIFTEGKQAMSEMMNVQIEQAKSRINDQNTLMRVMLLYLSNAKKLDLLR